MNELKATINFTKQTFVINGVDLISGDYNSTKITFNFEDIKNGTKILEIRPKDSEDKNPTFMGEIINNEVILVSKDSENNSTSPFTNGGVYLLEVSVYGDDSKLSTITKSINVLPEQIILSDDIVTPYLPIFDELIQEINTAITETNNLNITITKDNGITTVTLTKKDGTTSIVTIKDGIDGTDGIGIKLISKISTSGLVDTYRITLTDDSYYDYQVVNGRGIVSITKTDTTNYTDTYTITYNDGTTSTFTVTNGTMTREEVLSELDYIVNILPKVTGEGTSITLNNTGDSRLINLEIDGKSEQNGTPTPDSPIDINSVGYENILPNNATTQTINGVTFTKNNDGTITANGTATTNTSLIINSNLAVNGTLVLSTGLGINSDCYARALDRNNGYIVVLRTDNANIPYATLNTNIQVLIYVKGGFVCNNVIFKPMIVKGTQTHSYIPYGKYGIEVKTTGKNLCDIVLDNTISSTVLYKTYTLNPNQNYTISTNTYITSLSIANVFADSGTSLTPSTAGNGVNVSRTVTSDSNGNITIGYRNFNNTLDYSTGNYYIMIEKGSQATTYEPYQSKTQVYQLDNPLRSIENTKDLLYIRNGILYVNRKIGKVVFDGSNDENWSITTSPTYNTFYVDAITNYLKENKNICLSNYYESKTNITNASSAGNTNNTICFRYNDSLNLLYITNNDITSATNFKTWLSTHNTEVQYILNTPYTEEVGEVNYPDTFSTVTNITINDPLNPNIKASALKDISNL